MATDAHFNCWKLIGNYFTGMWLLTHAKVKV